MARESRRRRIRGASAKGVLVVALTLALAAVAGTGAYAQHLRCVPSCTAEDGRGLVLTGGEGLDTLTLTTLDMTLRVPASRTGFRLDVFDGELGGLWDLAFAPGDPSLEALTYTLYADPKGDGTGSKVVAVFDGASMADNAWTALTVGNDARALQKKGALYVYRLEVVLDPYLPATRAVFKLRTDEWVSLTVMGQRDNGAHGGPGPFAFAASLPDYAELGIIYPDCQGQPIEVCLGSLANTTYDGTFSFSMEVSRAQDELAIWDGDFDYGGFDATATDDDDFNTMDREYPPFVKGLGRTAYYEGSAMGCCVGGPRHGLACRLHPGDEPADRDERCSPGVCSVTGNPPDDFDASAGNGLGAIWVRQGSVEYDVLDPSGEVIGTCDNPAGNDEWELFRLAVPGDGYLDDHGLPPEVDASGLPARIYEIRVRQLDLENLAAFCLPFGFQPPNGDDGCTPGYWKQTQHTDSWNGYSTGDRYGDVFGVSPSFGNLTLLETLHLGDGGEMALARHAVAALLNAGNPLVDSGFTAGSVIPLVQLSYGDGEFEVLKDRLMEANERGCSLN